MRIGPRSGTLAAMVVRNGVAAQQLPRTVPMPPLSVRAEVASVDEEARTVDLVFSTGAPVERYDWSTGKRYLETLSLDASAVRIDRLNAGGPLLDSHSAWSVADQLGAVVPGSVELSGKQARATVRFSRREAVDGIWQDVRDGLIRSVSVGYRVYRFEETAGKGNALPVRLATDWEPFEISMVPIPADSGAKVRDGKSEDANTCEIVAAGAPPAVATRAAAPAPKKEKQPMDPVTRSETIVEHDPDAPAPQPQPTEPTEAERAVAIERERCQGIMAGCRTARLPQSFADRLIADPKMTLGEARGLILKELEGRNDPGTRGGGPATPSQGPTEVVVGDDPFVHKRKGIENALLHRVMPKFEKDGPGFELSPEGARYRGTSLLEIGEIFLRVQGKDTRIMTKMERAAALLSRSQHSTSDFPLLLADVANKTLRAAYDAAPQTWRAIARQVSLPDFKPGRQLQLGGAPALSLVGEGGEFTHGTMAEAKEQYQLKTYGKIFSITRQALINDDLNAFAQVPVKFGQSARNLESDLAWAAIIDNPVMGDSVQLFNAAHGNVDSSGAAISIDSLGAARTALRVQTDLDGTTVLNLAARYLIVPAALETIADQFVSTALLANASGQINPFAGRLQVIAEPRLDGDSALAWYVATSPDQVPVLYYVLLEGQTGPTVEQEIGFDVDGLKLKCRHDVAFAAADYRAIYKNVGES